MRKIKEKKLEEKVCLKLQCPKKPEKLWSTETHIVFNL